MKTLTNPLLPLDGQAVIIQESPDNKCTGCIFDCGDIENCSIILDHNWEWIMKNSSPGYEICHKAIFVHPEEELSGYEIISKILTIKSRSVRGDLAKQRFYVTRFDTGELTLSIEKLILTSEPYIYTHHERVRQIKDKWLMKQVFAIKVDTLFQALAILLPHFKEQQP